MSWESEACAGALCDTSLQTCFLAFRGKGAREDCGSGAEAALPLDRGRTPALKIFTFHVGGRHIRDVIWGAKHRGPFGSAGTACTKDVTLGLTAW